MASAPEPVNLLSLLDPSIRADPYPLYAQVREATPLLVGDGRLAVVASYDDCAMLLRHPHALSDRRRSTLFTERAGALAGGADPRVAEGLRWLVDTPMFLFLDPPDHTRLRRLVSKAFTARQVERLRPVVEVLTGELLDAVGDQMDVVADLAYPLPVTVIADLLGVPREDTPRLREWSAVLTRALDPTMVLTGRPAEGLDERLSAMAEFRDYFRDLAARRRREPRDDLVSALTAVEDGGDRLSSDELLSTCVLLLVAGHETTVSLIANGALALARHPDQLAALAADPGLAPGTVEEVLRYDPPVQLVARIAGEDLRVGPVTMPRGALALLLVAAAGRDPAANPDPDRFDVRRSEPRHLAFGLGPHFCLGAPLARLEAQIALRELARRFPRLQPPETPPRYRDNVTLRGLAELPLRVG
jgi:cytochrome P450